jgi:hypothetical protein
MRTAQFQIERHCPMTVPLTPLAWPPFPIAVWVRLDDPPPPLPCGKALYRVDTTRPAIGADGKLMYATPLPGYNARGLRVHGATDRMTWNQSTSRGSGFFPVAAQSGPRRIVGT